MSKYDVYEQILKPMESVFATPGNLDKDQRARALEQYADALQKFDAADLASGWRIARDAHKRRDWPTIAALIEACKQAERDRRDASPVRDALPVKGIQCDGVTPQDWPGACMCIKCVSKRRGRPAEVWRASPEEHRQAAALRAELDAWTKRPREHEPPQPPAEQSVHGATHVHRHSPEELDALAAKRQALVERMIQRDAKLRESTR